MIRNQTRVRAVLVYSIYIVLLSLLQVSWPSGLELMGSRPDLTLILAILCGYMFGQSDGILIGLSAGFFRDLLAGRALGLGMLLLMYAAMLASVMFIKFFRRNILLGLVQILLITVIYESLITLLTFIIPMLPDVTYHLDNLFRKQLDKMPGQLLVNAIAGAPLIFMLYFMGPYQRGNRKDDSEDSIVGDSVWRVN